MKYEDMSFTIPECGLLQSRHVYLFEGEVCECTISDARKDYLLTNLKTGESKKLDGCMAVLMEGQIRDITDAYIRENPDYAQDRMERAREDLRQGKNYYRACHLLEPVADSGDPEAQYLLAYCFYKAPDHMWSPDSVNKYLEKAAAQGHLKAQYFLAQNYRTGFNNTADPVLSARWYEKAALQGHAKAAAYNGQNHEYGVEGFFPADEKEAFHWYQVSAEAGDSLGMYRLGLAYENGVGTDADLKKALECYRKGAELDHRQCAFRCAYIQDPVYGFRELADGEAAILGYYKAKRLRDERASRYLGLHYSKGTAGVDINHRKALELFVDGASLGDAPCAAEAGRLYLYGDHGIRQNLWEAFKLCSQAAEAGDTTGMLLLAHYYLLVPSTEENTRKSLGWAEKAQAAGGNADALLEEAGKRLKEFRKEEKKKKGLFGRKR